MTDSGGWVSFYRSFVAAFTRMQRCVIITYLGKGEFGMHRVKPRQRWVAAVCAGLLLAFGAEANAEQIVYHEPHSGFTEVFDSENPGRYGSSGLVHSVVSTPGRGSVFTWNVTYADVTASNGIGFDDPAEGADRQATFEAVLAYVASVLNETSAATIDVEVAVSQTDGTGFLASAGTFFSLGNQFTNGAAFTHITTGTDPFGGSPDIFATFDFGYNWNSELDPVGGAEFDLATVALHEVTHGLGFLSLCSSSGTSSISSSNPGTYGVLAQFMDIDDAGPVGTGSSTPIFAAGGNFVGNVSDLTSTRLVFTGPNAVAAYGSNPTINSNNPFVSGTSLSHWGDDLAGLAVMPGFVVNGTEFREYANFEIGALIDLGYTNAAEPGMPEPPDADNDLLPDSVETDTGIFIDENDTGSDPNDFDSDNDGYFDGLEVALGTDPNDPFDFPIGLSLQTTALLTAFLGMMGVAVFIGLRRRKLARASRR